MSKMWAGRTTAKTNKLADCFNSSISFDKRLYVEDIQASIAHAKMLSKQKIIKASDANKIIKGLNSILADISSGKLKIDLSSEDIHMFVEQVLTKRIGDAGKRLHTARSRNDQVAQDLKLYLINQIDGIIWKIKKLITTIINVANKNKTLIIPGYTHLQHAQPILISHHMLAYGMMLLRDVERFNDCGKRLQESPIGSCALAGTTYNINRDLEAKTLGFKTITQNSMDSVADRDYCVEFINCSAILMMHLSRLSEDIILWSSSEFGYIELDDAFTTGSSIMPQKKNPDMAELVRGKTGRVYGHLISMLTMLKGLPLTYNKDMQEDKECIFDTIDTVNACLSIYEPMLATMKTNSKNMKKSANVGFMNATDLADYLVKKGIPFRSAYKIVGQIVRECIKTNKTLDTLPLGTYKKFSNKFAKDLYKDIAIANCVKKRTSKGGTSLQSVNKQIAYLNKELKKY